MLLSTYVCLENTKEEIWNFFFFFIETKASVCLRANGPDISETTVSLFWSQDLDQEGRQTLPAPFLWNHRPIFHCFFFLYVCDRTQTRFQTHPSHPTGCNLNVAAEKKASGAIEPLGLEPDCRVRQHTTATHFLRHSSLMSGFLRNVQEDAEKWGWFAVGVVCGAAAT